MKAHLDITARPPPPRKQDWTVTTNKQGKCACAKRRDQQGLEPIEHLEQRGLTDQTAFLISLFSGRRDRKLPKISDLRYGPKLFQQAMRS
ncbi:MAG: hypothetical protein U1F35_04520 [Steroidobacteraceae bacterium]